jgi:hypothetical protein
VSASGPVQWLGVYVSGLLIPGTARGGSGHRGSCGQLAARVMVRVHHARTAGFTDWRVATPVGADGIAELCAGLSRDIRTARYRSTRIPSPDLVFAQALATPCPTSTPVSAALHREAQLVRVGGETPSLWPVEATDWLGVPDPCGGRDGRGSLTEPGRSSSARCGSVNIPGVSRPPIRRTRYTFVTF